VSLSVKALRKRLAEQIATMGDWKESPRPFDLFPGDPQGFAPYAFAVGVPGTTYDSPVESKRSVANVGTQVRIRWLAYLRGDSLLEDFDATLDTEAELVATVMATSRETGLHLILVGQSRQIVQGNWMQGELTLLAKHPLALT
jgi:hypothetical protein